MRGAVEAHHSQVSIRRWQMSRGAVMMCPSPHVFFSAVAEFFAWRVDDSSRRKSSKNEHMKLTMPMTLRSITVGNSSLEPRVTS